MKMMIVADLIRSEDKYHIISSHKSISIYYHTSASIFLIFKSHSKVKTAHHPTSGMVKIDDSRVSFHGPFKFATLNNRKLQDRISEKDWLILSEQ
jgi:hypothetical protein